MTREVQAHQTSVSFLNAAPVEFYAGGDLTLQVKVACSSNCNLQGGYVRIVAAGGVTEKETPLVAFDGTANTTAEFSVKAPITPGEYTWTAVFVAQEQEDVSHAASSVPFSFVVKPHTTSMAVWDVPSPIVVSARVKIKVGVQCSAQCNLAGKSVALYDHAGALAATGALGAMRWSDAGALYWAEVELEAPGAEGAFSWEARFSKSNFDLLHENAFYAFGFRTAKPPDHAVTVQVLNQDTHTPIPHAQVFLHPYREYTDENGLARLMVSKGNYELYIMTHGMKMFQTAVQVAGAVTVRAELEVAPVEDTSG